MHTVLLVGAGKIGRMIARFLHDCGDYRVRVADASVEALTRLKDRVDVETLAVDATDPASLATALNGVDAVISALSYQFNEFVAEAALRNGASYFDLTEDVRSTRQITRLAERAADGQVFMPQCGLAPGFISIIAAHLFHQFEDVDSIHMRVGALPQFPTNMLKYNLTWSTDGLINEYCNPCDVIFEGKTMEMQPLEGVEAFSLDGVEYEAFNTSGGLGTLCSTLDGRVRELNYKTIRYPGHRDLMHFLLNELRLSTCRVRLKEILEASIPITFQDVVVTFCTVTGRRRGQLVQLADARKIYSREIAGEMWSGIQITTASAICAALDLHLQGVLPSRGLVRQEEIKLEDFMSNRFGKVYDVAPAPSIYTGPPSS
ncbi:MAG: saccharopine dehydrogenase NADP-binding domain-containing protein [Planctomycetaceae bacterium]